MKHTSIFLLVLLFVAACSTKRTVEQSHSSDSSYTELRESIVYVPVTTIVEVPEQTAERETRDSNSHLETAFACSDASIVWRGGVPYLHHSLANKPQRIEQTQTVPVKQQRLTIYRRIIRTRYVYKYVERQLSLYQRLMLNLAPWIIIGLIIYIIYMRTRSGERN